MIPFCPPPLYYVKYPRTAAWLRLGKAALFSILAGLAIAIGLALPDGKDAEAQGLRNGYSYSRLICQEWGRQPAWYTVRDPIPGSDWRNDGGWAIILNNGTVFYGVNASGPYVLERDSSPARYVRFTPDASGNPQRYDYDTGPPGQYWPDSEGLYVRIGPGGNMDHSAYLRVTFWAQPIVRYSRNGTGGFVRWADMRWCR